MHWDKEERSTGREKVMTWEAQLDSRGQNRTVIHDSEGGELEWIAKELKVTGNQVVKKL